MDNPWLSLGTFPYHIDVPIDCRSWSAVHVCFLKNQRPMWILEFSLLCWRGCVYCWKAVTIAWFNPSWWFCHSNYPWSYISQVKVILFILQPSLPFRDNFPQTIHLGKYLRFNIYIIILQINSMLYEFKLSEEIILITVILPALIL